MNECFAIKSNLQNKTRQNGLETLKCSLHRIMKPSETSSSSSSLQTSSSLTETMVIPEPKYKGVRKRKWGKWVSEIRLPNSRERIWLGSYDSAEKAARAFDAALYCLRGRGAKFNFPDDPPEIEGGDSLGPQEIQVVAGRYANEGPRRREIALITRGIMEENTSLSYDGGAMQIERSSNVECGAIDWSFLNMLETGSDYGLHYSPPQPPLLPQSIDSPPPPLPPQNIDGNVEGDSSCPNDDQGYSQHSFLWNF